MKNILIAGGTGLVGKYLTKHLLEKGYNVAHLSRTPQKNSTIKQYHFNWLKNEIDENAFKDCYCIVNLAGENIGSKRWTNYQKQQIISSRTQTSQLIYNAVKSTKASIHTYISASAIGYYGNEPSEKIFTETDKNGSDFLAETCVKWEHSADMFSDIGMRVIKIRTGIVLAKDAVIIQKLKPIFSLSLGSAVGHGKQYMPWIHVHDLCSIYVQGIENLSMIGAYNAVAPEHITNYQFTQTFAKVLDKPFFMPNVPSAFIQLAMGEMSQLLLTGNKISCEKIMKTGFQFEYNTINSAYSAIL